MIPTRSVVRAFTLSPTRHEMLEDLTTKGKYSELVGQLIEERWDQERIEGLRDAVVKLIKEYKDNLGAAQ